MTLNVTVVEVALVADAEAAADAGFAVSDRIPGKANFGANW